MQCAPQTGMADRNVDQTGVFPRATDHGGHRMEDIAGVHVTKHVELPQTRSFDKIVDVPVGMRRQMPAILTLQKTMEVLQSLYLDPRNGRARCEQRTGANDRSWS